MTASLLRSLIRETLLLEEVYGAQAIVYHGTEADPVQFVEALLNDEFEPGRGAGSSTYGKGLYAVYNLKNTSTERGIYGDSLIKLKVNLYGYIIFDPDVALKVYKKPLSPSEQAREIGLDKDMISSLEEIEKEEHEFTSELAFRAKRFLQYKVKGLVYTVERIGTSVVIYDPTTAIPIAWKKIEDFSWNKVDKSKLLEPKRRLDLPDGDQYKHQSSIRRSAVGDWEAGKYDLDDVFIKLPRNSKVVRGILDLSRQKNVSLPQNLIVKGDLLLSRSDITSLPRGLKVGKSLDMSDTKIASIPSDISVGKNVRLYGTEVSYLPPNLEVHGDLDVAFTPMETLPKGLKVDGRLNLYGSKILQLPEDLQVGESISGFKGDRSTIPKHLTSKVH
jgi:hypothetical protein